MRWLLYSDLTVTDKCKVRCENIFLQVFEDDENIGLPSFLTINSESLDLPEEEVKVFCFKFIHKLLSTEHLAKAVNVVFGISRQR